MAYSFRFYGKANRDWFVDDHLVQLRYDLQFRSPPTSSQLDRLGELVEQHFAQGPAVAFNWQFSDRFALSTFAERYPGAARSMTYQVTDFLMEARQICPLVDVVLLGAPSAGVSRWDTWTTGVQPMPDPGPAWDPRLVGGHYRRPIDPALPAPTDEPAFDAGRQRASNARQVQRLLDVKASAGLSVAQVPASQVPAIGSPTLPDDTPADVRISVHPDGQRAVYASKKGDAIYELDSETNTWRERGTGGHRVVSVAWAGELWAVATADTLELRDPSQDEPALIGEPYGIKGGLVESFADGKVLLNLRQSTLTVLVRRASDKYVKKGSIRFKSSPWFAGQYHGRVFLGAYGLGDDRLEVLGLQPLVPGAFEANPRLATPTKTTRASKTASLSLETVDTLPEPDVDWPDATAHGKPTHLAQTAPDGTTAMFLVEDKHLVATLRILRPGGQRVDLSCADLGGGLKDLAVEPGGRSVMVARVVERFGEAKLQESSRGYLPQRNSIPNAWMFTEVAVASGQPTQAFELELAPKPLSDGNKRGYRDLRTVARPGGVNLFVWNKQPYHTMRWLGPDDLLVVHQKGAFWMQRTADGWRELGQLKASGTIDAHGVAARRVVGVVGTGKTRLTVYGDVGGKVRKLGTFTDPIVAVHPRGERLFVELADATFAEVSGLPG